MNTCQVPATVQRATHSKRWIMITIIIIIMIMIIICTNGARLSLVLEGSCSVAIWQASRSLHPGGFPLPPLVSNRCKTANESLGAQTRLIADSLRWTLTGSFIPSFLHSLARQLELATRRLFRSELLDKLWTSFRASFWSEFRSTLLAQERRFVPFSLAASHANMRTVVCSQRAALHWAADANCGFKRPPAALLSHLFSRLPNSRQSIKLSQTSGPQAPALQANGLIRRDLL